MASSHDKPFTTLPPIFTARGAGSAAGLSSPAAAATAGGAQSLSSTARHYTRSHAAAESAHASLTASGLPRIHQQRKPALPQLKRPRDRNDDGTDNRARTAGGSSLVYFASGSGPRAATRGPHGVPLGGPKAAHLPRRPAASDEANIAPDGTVTFGPNLQLQMPSLVVRFEDARAEHGLDTTGGGGGGASNAAGSTHASHTLLTSRKRAAKKAKEWAQMSALYDRAMEDKAAAAARDATEDGGVQDMQQAQWFMARFSYPMVHQPAPQPPQQPQPVSTRRGSQAQRAADGTTIAAAGLHSDWMPAASANAVPIDAGAPRHLAHLLHTASASALGANVWPAAASASSAGSSTAALHMSHARDDGAVEEEPAQLSEEDEDADAEELQTSSRRNG